MVTYNGITIGKQDIIDDIKHIIDFGPQKPDHENHYEHLSFDREDNIMDKDLHVDDGHIVIVEAAANILEPPVAPTSTTTYLILSQNMIT